MTVFDVVATRGNETALVRINTGSNMAVLVDDGNSINWTHPELFIAGFQDVQFHELTRDMVTNADISPYADQLYINFFHGGMHQTFTMQSGGKKSRTI